MPKETIIDIIVVLIVLAAIVALLIFLTIRKIKYEKFVLSNSESIKKLEELNKKYIFETYKAEIELWHRFDNKGHWYKTEPTAYLSREIRNDLEKWFTLCSKIKSNRVMLEEYNSDIEKIDMTISPDFCSLQRMNYKKCLKVEKRLFEKKTQKPGTDIAVTVVLRYVSPKGKVDLSKRRTVGYTELTRILDSVSTRRVDRATYEKLSSVERAILSDGMRYDVLKRDGFRCVLCGTSSQDGAVLHVDHIIPISKGGKTEMNNLRTLCEKCNIGKSNKIE